jgi:hypothetical protein
MKDSLLNIAKTDHLSQEEADFLHLMETSWGVSETALDEVTVAEVQNEVLPEEGQNEVPSEEESNRQMVAAMGDYPLEYRISLLAYRAVCADGYLTKAEKQAVTNYVNSIYSSLNDPSAAAAILEDCWSNLSNSDLLDESIQLLKQFLSRETLQQVKDDFLNLAQINKWIDGEVDFIHHLEAVWEVD